MVPTKFAMLAFPVLAALVMLAGAPAAQGNAIQDENALAGSSGWNVKEPPRTMVEGYSKQISVTPGGQVDLAVASAVRYRVEVFRLGWYGGLGGRRLACLPNPNCSTDEPAVAQPAAPAPDPTTGIVRAGWNTTDTIAVGTGWVSGYYMAVVRPTTGSYVGRGYRIPFMVRPSPAATGQTLVQAAVNTWLAYNPWGGKSLYTSNSSNGVAANHVSFDRPFDHVYGNTSPLTHEIQFVRYLEREGFDVSYQADTDTDADPSSLWRFSAVVANGHDEYWSREMRDAFDGAKRGGQDLLFAGADIGYWQIRYADDRRTIVEYRIAAKDPEPDPMAKTAAFRKLSTPRPECDLIGVQYAASDDNGAKLTDGKNFTVFADPTTTLWMGGTGLTQGQKLVGMVGYEWDSIIPGCGPPDLRQVLFAAGAKPASSVSYTAPSGARVASFGSIFFSYALDNFGVNSGTATPMNPGVQAYVRAMLTDMGAPGDTVAPYTRITAPPAPLSGDQSPSIGFVSTEPAATFECDLDDTGWQPCASPLATGPLAGGVHTLLVRATDPAGNVEPVPASVSWTVCNIVGTAGADTLVGTPGDDVICGFGGDDRLNGGEGDDRILGGDGNDKLFGDDGADQLRGDAGNDSLDGGAGPDVMSGGAGTDTVSYVLRKATQPVSATIDGLSDSGDTSPAALDSPLGGAPGDTIALDVESLLGGAGADTLTGSAVANNISGNAGDDTLSGGAGKDTLIGGLGADTLFGREGDDKLVANDGAADAQLDCDGATSEGAADSAKVDAVDPAPLHCESVS